MPRRNPSSSGVYHFMQRGVIQRNLFHSKHDYETYVSLVKKAKSKFGVQIYHYCLMTNHVHKLLKAANVADLSSYGHWIGKCYADHYRKKYRHSGQVFERSFKTKFIEDDIYLYACGRYIERNPLEAGIVSDPDLYPWSSSSFYSGKRADSHGILTPSPFHQLSQNQLSHNQLS